MYLALGVVFDDDDRRMEPLKVYKMSKHFLNVLITNKSYRKLKSSQLAALAVY